LHTLSAEPAKRRLLVGIGGDAAALDEDMLDIDLTAWVNGEDLPVKELTGQLGGMLLPIEWPPKRSARKPTAKRRPMRDVA
jgi:hypothetical protein